MSQSGDRPGTPSVAYRRNAGWMVAAIALVVAATTLIFAITLAARPTATAPAASSAPAPLPSAVRTPLSTAISVPATIDASGATDASAALTAWLSGVPDGSTIVFQAGGVYRMDQGLAISDRRNLTFEGNGATLRANGPDSCGRECSLFYLQGGNRGIIIRGFVLAGNSVTPGTYDPAREHASGITVVGGGQVELAEITVEAVGGDALTITGSAPEWPNDIWFHDSHVISAGRNGVAVIAGSDVVVERVAFDASGYTVFDIEPNTDRQGASNIRFLDNTAGTWTNSFVSAEGAPGSEVNGVVVSGNTVTGGSLLTAIELPRRQNVTFINNTSQVPGDGPVLRFAHVDGLTVTGNVQPLNSDPLASITDCTSVTTDFQAD